MKKVFGWNLVLAALLFVVAGGLLSSIAGIGAQACQNAYTASPEQYEMCVHRLRRRLLTAHAWRRSPPGPVCARALQVSASILHAVLPLCAARGGVRAALRMDAMENTGALQHRRQPLDGPPVLVLLLLAMCPLPGAPHAV